MKKVLLISDNLEHYRIPLFNNLCDKIHLTVAYSNDKYKNSVNFSKHIIRLEQLGPLVVYKDLPSFNDFDCVILPFNIRCLELWRQIFKKRKFKLIVFGIGVTASYGKHYDEKNNLDFLRRLIIKKSDFAIFYEQYPYIKYIAAGLPAYKMSVAYNTVAPNPNFTMKNKEYKSLLFIGSLYRQKKIFDLLDAYLLANETAHGKIPPLEIIGDGEEYENVSRWITENNFCHKIFLHGQINEDDLILPIMNRAIACISPGQAGLSVQKCFSYGIPFVTSNKPITGGEFFSIIDGVTGYIYDSSKEDLSSVIIKLSEKSSIEKMSNNAYSFYSNFRNVSIWKRGFLKNIL